MGIAIDRKRPTFRFPVARGALSQSELAALLLIEMLLSDSRMKFERQQNIRSIAGSLIESHWSRPAIERRR